MRNVGKLIAIVRDERDARLPDLARQVLQVLAGQIEQLEAAVAAIDPLVLEATRGLLRSWGCCVVSAESCDEALVCLDETEAGRRPDLIVCDYQLSRGLTGVDAIERLPGAFGKIPALLISGDASSPRCEVGPRAYQLLYKPLNAERFYAALVEASVLRR